MQPLVKDKKLGIWCALFARNTIIKHVPLFEGCESCQDRPLPESDRLPKVLVPDFPVDVVYAWVDGSDPALAAKRAQYLPPEKKRTWASHGVALFRDNDELRFSLRSLEAYAPWVRRVFIVTDNQTPVWLDTTHEKICMVDHRDFIPHEYLPTFSSRPIEAFLHRIPDLGEHYIYLNDDFFLAAPCGKDLFFAANGLPHLFRDWRKSRREGFENPKSPHTHSYANVRNYLEKHGIYNAPHAITTHAPYAQTLGNANSGFTFFEEAVRSFASNKFRTIYDMVFYCHTLALYSCSTKRAVPIDVPYYYINTKRFDHQAHYDALLRQKGKPCQPPFFCLNDVGNRPWTNAWRHHMAAFLQAYYPTPSSFEKSS